MWFQNMLVVCTYENTTNRRGGHGMAVSNRMRSIEVVSKHVWSLYIWKHSTPLGVTKRMPFPHWNELRTDITEVCLGFVHMKIQKLEGERSVANKKDKEIILWSKRTGSEVYVDAPGWNFRIQACNSNYMKAKPDHWHACRQIVQSP